RSGRERPARHRRDRGIRERHAAGEEPVARPASPGRLRRQPLLGAHRPHDRRGVLRAGPGRRNLPGRAGLGTDDEPALRAGYRPSARVTGIPPPGNTPPGARVKLAPAPAGPPTTAVVGTALGKTNSSYGVTQADYAGTDESAQTTATTVGGLSARTTSGPAQE